MLDFVAKYKAESILSLLPNSGIVGLVDVGAAGDLESRWLPVRGKLVYSGFEPDKRSVLTLSQQKNQFFDYEIYPVALSDVDGPRKLNLCKKPQVSSFYRPNYSILQRFPNLQRFKIEESVILNCVTLNSIPLKRADFLKVDVQGAELDVLRGATVHLREILGVEVEVEFIPVYENQPLFGQIVENLTEAGFEFVDFVNLVRWQRDSLRSYGTCVFGDALFLRSPEDIDLRNMSLDKIASYLSILFIYRRFDMINVFFDKMDKTLYEDFKAFHSKCSKIERRLSYIKFLHRVINHFFSYFGNSYKVDLHY